ncbi:MAG TPA: glycosyltransferase [Candidatus Limnocylindrales bacterium]|nr:glycosyltransferase [Candidatus Limnocylindrales bacterium]
MNVPTGLACPRCHGALRADERTLLCPTCAVRYPVVDGIPFFGDPPEAAADAPTCGLSVIIPALNEAASLERMLPELRTAVDTLGVTAEVIVVDGGSRDATVEVARHHGARAVVQDGPGYGGALRTGFREAHGEYLLTLDADGSHSPAFFRDIWAARTSAEVVIASRYVAGGRAEMPLVRSILSQILNLAFRRGLSLPARDLSSGFRLYARRAVCNLQLTAVDFDVLEEILIRTIAAGYQVREIPFHYRARLSGKSHADLRKFALSYLRTFLRMWRLRNSIASADYDARAYDSLVPLQRYWQRGRFKAITGFARGFHRVLDVGCGSSRILGSDRSMVGLDIMAHKLRFGRRYGNPLVQGSIFSLPFADASFDCVICSEVVEHIPPDARAFTELARVLQPGGRLILGTPDYDRWAWRALEWLYGKLAPGGYADEHITHYRRAGLQAYLQGIGFRVERIAYVGGSEMIFCLRKDAVPAVAAPAVETALRAA